jgi:hypothetical protein
MIALCRVCKLVLFQFSQGTLYYSLLDSSALVSILGYVWPAIGIQYSATSTQNPKIGSQCDFQ